MALKKIVAVGPESTGKSMLCQQLATHYSSFWCPEYAREYLLKNGTSYTYDDLLDVAKGQLALEDKLTAEAEAAGHEYLFIDTDMYVMKVWCEFVFGKCHRFILDQIATREYHQYLLCNTDLPWVKDELREYPDLERRQRLFQIYHDLMINQSTPWALISGENETRINQAIEVVERM